VTLNQEEIIQACIEWAERHHGLVVGGKTLTRATLEGTVGGDAIYTCHRISIDFEDAKSGRPYRDGTQ